MLARIHAVAAAVWAGLAGGAAAGFLARDALGLRQPLVALAWTAGAAIPLIAIARSRMRNAWRGSVRDERGQAAVELAALMLLVALAAAVALSPRFDGRSFGGFLAFRVVCTIQRDCHEGDGSSTRAYGDRHAALVRDLAPSLAYEQGERQLPVNWRAAAGPAAPRRRTIPTSTPTTRMRESAPPRSLGS